MDLFLMYVGAVVGFVLGYFCAALMFMAKRSE